MLQLGAFVRVCVCQWVIQTEEGGPSIERGVRLDSEHPHAVKCSQREQLKASQ